MPRLFAYTVTPHNKFCGGPVILRQKKEVARGGETPHSEMILLRQLADQNDEEGGVFPDSSGRGNAKKPLELDVYCYTVLGL